MLVGEVIAMLSRQKGNLGWLPVAVIWKAVHAAMMSFRDSFAPILIGVFVLTPLAAQPTAQSGSGIDASKAETANDIAPGSGILETEFGSFLVVRNVERPVEPPILHAAPPAKDAKLIWRNVAGDFEMTMIDDGFTVELNIAAGNGFDHPTCLSSIILTPNFERTASRNWTTVRDGVGRLLKSCRLPKNYQAQLQSEMVAAADHYPAAANAWKSISRELFGPSTRRCIKTKFDRNFQFPLIRCTRYSG